jgi:hypothetical protein
MAKNTQGVNELAQRLAVLSDSVDKLFPNGKKMIVFELKQQEFQNAKIQFDIMTTNIKRFNIDISGIEFIFIEDELLNVEEGNS